ncbi:MAG: hypothetical protein BWY82_02350 [Verrucomicrobia bacterium ADurb.Bin474]|nr:MAG: hypothetical protein BWY82_02350 [Verrucomicrobia bacterium ADurb.Bin474]
MFKVPNPFNIDEQGDRFAIKGNRRKDRLFLQLFEVVLFAEIEFPVLVKSVIARIDDHHSFISVDEE